MRAFITILVVSMVPASGTVAAEGAVTLELSIYAFMHVAAGTLATIAILVMLWGCIKALWSFINTEFRGGSESERNTLRSRLGHFILFGLELLIVADLIETTTAPDIQHVLVLALIVFIRTVISVSLNWELAQEEKRVNKKSDVNTG